MRWPADPSLGRCAGELHSLLGGLAVASSPFRFRLHSIRSSAGACGRRVFEISQRLRGRRHPWAASFCAEFELE